MPTHAQLAAQLLRDAASFFRTIAEQNEPLRSQMGENAAVFDEVAMLVERDPTGEIAAPGLSPDHGGGCCGGGHHHDDGKDDDGGCCGGGGGGGGGGCGCSH